MKRLIIYAGVVLLAIACTNKPTTENIVATTDVATDYPYTLEKEWKNWQVGDQKHIGTVLKMLKAWETKNVAECVTYFADSADIALDKFHKKLSNDSLKTFLQGSYTNYASNLKISVQDWESVISADKKDEWVTVWYKQSWVNAKGVADSVDLINEAKMKDGKIVYFDEYTLHFPDAKK